MRYEFKDLCQNLFINILHNIYIVGGTSRINKIKKIIKKIFSKRKIKDNLNPDETVGFGAILESDTIIKLILFYNILFPIIFELTF